MSNYTAGPSMRVVVNALQAANRSGTGTYVTHLVRALPQAAPDVEFCVAWPREAPHPPIPTQGHIAYLPGPQGKRFARVWHEQWQLPGEAARLRADLVHYPSTIAPLRRVDNLVLTVHDVAFLVDPSWTPVGRLAYLRATVPRAVKRARRIISVSHATARDLHERLGVPMDRIDVVHEGVDLARFYPAPVEQQVIARAKYNLPERYFLFLGTLEPRKNLVRLIGAWSAIAGECPCDLVIAGRDGWKCGPIHGTADRSPYAERIHRPGFVTSEDMAALMSGAVAVVFPSLYEGFGLPVLEAMACGTPVLTADVSSLPEVAGDAAVMVDPHDLDALSHAMIRLGADSTLCEDLRRKGLARATEFTWSRAAQETVRVYRRAVER